MFCRMSRDALSHVSHNHMSTFRVAPGAIRCCVLHHPETQSHPRYDRPHPWSPLAEIKVAPSTARPHRMDKLPRQREQSWSVSFPADIPSDIGKVDNLAGLLRYPHWPLFV